ncbi:MAG: sulfatase [Bryobacteraceae bacterium]
MRIVVNRRRFLASSLGTAPLAQPAGRRRRPNIIVVMMDDFGIGHFAPHAESLRAGQSDPAHIQFIRERGAAYSEEEALAISRRAMPTLSALARRGAVFTNAFASSNLCAPARSGVLMGRLQNRFGLYQNSDVEARGMPDGMVLAAQLQKAGYATAFIGKWHAGPRDATLPAIGAGRIGSVIRRSHPLENGFDYYFGYNHYQCPFYDSEQIWENREYTGLQKRYNTDLFTDKAIAFMRQARQAGRPFFVEAAYHAVHAPLRPQAPDRYFKQFEGAPAVLQNFYAHVYAVDQSIAAMRDALGPDWDNTLFIFCGDNGAPASLGSPPPANAPHRGHKGTLLLGGIRVPLLMHWTAGIRGGGRRKELVSALDVMPTALDAAGVPAPADLDGRSVLPLLAGKTRAVHDNLVLAGIHARSWGFLGATTMGTANPERRREESPGAWVVCDGRYLLRYVTSIPAGLFNDVPDGRPGAYELYDLREDPLEQKDLTVQLPQVVRELRAVYEKEAHAFPPPAKWRADRWREMMPPDNLHLKDGSGGVRL